MLTTQQNRHRAHSAWYVITIKTGIQDQLEAGLYACISKPNSKLCKLR